MTNGTVQGGGSCDGCGRRDRTQLIRPEEKHSSQIM